MELRCLRTTDARELLEAHSTCAPAAATGRRRRSTTRSTAACTPRARCCATRRAGSTLLDRETGEELAAGGAQGRQAALRPRPARALRAGLADVIEMRALTPVARLRARAPPLAVLNEDAKTVVRLHRDPPASTGGSPPPRSRATRASSIGSSQTSSWTQATLPLVDEAIAASGRPTRRDERQARAHARPRGARQRGRAVVFDRLLEVIRDNLPGTLDDVDSEFLHDLRVAVRRTRSLQRQFKRDLPRPPAAPPRRVQAPAAVTGDLRDLDVYLLDFPDLRASLPEQMRPTSTRCASVLEAHRAQALTRDPARAQRPAHRATR